MTEEERKHYSNVVADCVKTSAELLEAVKKFYVQLQKEKERDGISLYEVKNRDLLAYMHNLAYLMYQMICGKSIEGDPAIERLVYLRTVLERIRPIEHRMKNEVEKLVALTVGNTSSEVKTLRPHPERLKINDEEEDVESGDGSSEDVGKGMKPKKYVPPKVMAVHYNEDEEAAEERKIERARRRALQSSLIQDLRAQYTDAPEQFQDDSIIRKKKLQDVEKKKYEEDYLIRLQVTKKERHKKRLENRQNILDELLNFGSYMAMENVEQGGDGSPSRKRRKMGKKGKFAKKSRLAGAKGKKGKGKSGKKKR